MALRALLLFAFLLLGAFAFSPLLRAGLLAEDYAALLDARAQPSVAAQSGRAPEFIDVDPPLTRLSLELSRSLHRSDTAEEPFHAFAVRAENLFLLLLGGVGLGFYLRRLLLPWTGSDHAASAAMACAAIQSLHPLAIPAVAEVGARGELLATALGAWSAALFLKGRQDRQFSLTATSALLCALAAFAHPLVLGLPILLSVSELVSSHRYRPLRVRLRTAFTTLAVFLAAASLDLLLSWMRFGPSSMPAGLRALLEVDSGQDLARHVVGVVEQLGLLVLPANPQVLKLAGVIAAGALFLCALHPVLGAARSAPKLWGWILFGWLAALVGSTLLRLDLHVTPGELFLASSLLPSAAIMSMGLGLCTTALSGVRRTLIPALVVLGYAILAHGNALPWNKAALAAQDLRRELLAVRELHGAEATVAILDPPSPLAGVDPLGRAVDRLLDPGLDRAGEDSDHGPTRVVAMASEAFLALCGEPELEQLRRDSTVLLLPAEAGAEGEPSAGRRAVSLAPSIESTGLRSWRGEARSPSLDIDPLAFSVLRVRATRGTSTGEPPRVSWSARANEARQGTLEGRWLDDADEPSALFHLGSSLAWRLGGRVRLLFLEGAILRVAEAGLEPVLPALEAGSPEVRGADWFLAPPFHTPRAGGRFVVGLLDLADTSYEEIGAITEAGGWLRVPGAARQVAEAFRTSGGPVAWTLDYRIDGHTVARTRGRRVTRSESSSPD